LQPTRMLKIGCRKDSSLKRAVAVVAAGASSFVKLES
jgi:hypothetical protein